MKRTVGFVLLCCAWFCLNGCDQNGTSVTTTSGNFPGVHVGTTNVILSLTEDNYDLSTSTLTINDFQIRMDSMTAAFNSLQEQLDANKMPICTAWIGTVSTTTLTGPLSLFVFNDSDTAANQKIETIMKAAANGDTVKIYYTDDKFGERTITDVEVITKKTENDIEG